MQHNWSDRKQYLGVHLEELLDSQGKGLTRLTLFPGYQALPNSAMTRSM